MIGWLGVLSLESCYWVPCFDAWGIAGKGGAIGFVEALWESLMRALDAGAMGAIRLGLPPGDVCRHRLAASL